MNIENNNKDFLPNIFLFQPELEQKNNFLQLLKESEFTVLYITNLEALYKNLLSGSCQILLIDIDQLGEQAVSIIKYLVSIKLDISIITLTSFDKNGLNRKVIAAGADFYLVTPFRDKLLEIFKSVIDKNQFKQLSNKFPRENFEDHCSVWILDKNAGLLKSPSGKQLHLTRFEFSLLEALYIAKDNEKIYIEKEVIAQKIYGTNSENGNSRFSLLLTRLRKKASNAFGEDLPIRTEYLTGYSFMGRLEMI